MGVFVFGTIYAALFRLLMIESSPLTAVIIGLIHGLLVGLSLPIVVKIDPGMRSGRTPYPGIMAINFGWIAAFGLVGAHVVYGIIYGAFYVGGSHYFDLGSAWIAGFLGTIGMTIVVEAGRLLKISDASTVAMLATTIDVILSETLERLKHRTIASG